MVHINTLPCETLSTIFEYLEPTTRLSPKSDLLHCIQVCRLWHDLATPSLYRRMWVYIASPPAKDDTVRKLFSNVHSSQIRYLSILITSGGYVYETQQQCGEMIEYINKTMSMIEDTTNLRLADLDLCPFTPADSITSLQPSLHAVNDFLVSLTRTIAPKTEALRLRLSRPDIMAEAQVARVCHPVFDDIVTQARGRLVSLGIGCPLTWLVTWIRKNPQLQELSYTKTSASESYEIADFWEVVQSCNLRNLMLDGVDFPPIQKMPVGLVELILTRLEDTAFATEAILTHLPNLKVLSLRWGKKTEVEGALGVSVGRIVSQGLRKAWWTFSLAPTGTIVSVAKACVFLESLSLPRNITDTDIFGISQTANSLTEVWIMDCPGVTISGLLFLKALQRLNHLQLQKGLSGFLSDESLKTFIADCNTLVLVTLVFEDRQDETRRRQELFAKISGPIAYRRVLTRASTYHPSNLGDRVTFDIKIIRDSIV